MTRRLASKTRLASWKRKPSIENWISPATARPTLAAMTRMLSSTEREGWETPQVQLVRRVMTGPAA